MHPKNEADRRQFERIALKPMYTPVSVRVGETASWLEGHAYDVSEGGVQLELDAPIMPGTPVAVRITLPRAAGREERDVSAVGNVVWTDDDGVDGPVRMAVVFSGFTEEDGRERLRRTLEAPGAARRAA
ncbi:MAG: PilZ domain-containing protein [Phycisphaerales bacterium]|nr:PilZ domain-containing protein [Phycisphaerales bacterium]